jgi:hypothetical protein
MVTLHIEHRITDFATWKRAFDQFAERRAAAGVEAARILQPTDDPNWLVVQLDFPTEAAALRFKSFLETEVWSSPERSPALDGPARARVLVEAPA